MKKIAIFILSIALALTVARAFASELALSLSDHGDRKGADRLLGLWLMGQSLCEGAEALPVVTTSDSGRGNYSFQRGVRTWIYGDHCARPEDRPNDQFAFVPLKAAVNGGLGETIDRPHPQELRLNQLD